MASKQVIKKITTGLTGLMVSPNPHYELTTLYGRILRGLEKMPQTSAYRKYTEEIVKSRLAYVQNETDVLKLEEKIGMGQIEEVIMQARYEADLVLTMLKYKPWESLVEQAPVGQWKWPV